jgi:dethiobiotin synthetase
LKIVLARSSIPGFFVTGTDTDVGKTVIAAAIARHLRVQRLRVGVCKPVATGCPRRREGLVSEDAELLAHHADSPFPLDVICPVRYAEPVAPAVAAGRSGEPLDWAAVGRSLATISQESDVMIVEGAGGVLVPIDDRYSMLDLMAALALPAIIVARASLGTINHTLLTVRALRSANVPIAGIIINRYPGENASVAEETAPSVIERWAGVPVLALAPHEPFTPPQLPGGVISAIDAVDWATLLHRGKPTE